MVSFIYIYGAVSDTVAVPEREYIKDEKKN